MLQGRVLLSSQPRVVQVIEVCRTANRHLEVKRARFSSLHPQALQTAISNLGPPNENDSLAVDARQELDLRIGASFTRLQTLLLQVRSAAHPPLLWLSATHDETVDQQVSDLSSTDFT